MAEPTDADREKACVIYNQIRERHGIPPEDHIAQALAAEREATKEAAAKVCEMMQPHGGRMFTPEQAACFEALGDAATNIRRMNP